MIYTHALPITEVLDEWDKIDKQGTDKSAVRVLCQEDLFYLLVKVCGRKDMLHPWIYQRCREVEANPDGYLDLWSREHFKSSIITFGKTIQDILNNPNITVGIISENYTLAQKFLNQIKTELENNEILKAVFPDILWKDPKQQAEKWNADGITVKRSSNPKEPTVECQGLLSMKTGAHYELMVFDDIITLNSVSSPEMVSKITDFFEMSLSLSKEGGKKRGIGTRYSFADTYQHIIDREIWEVRLYPATEDGTRDGKPVMFTQEYWETKKRENSDNNLNCQYLQNPLQDAERKFDITDLRMYEIRPLALNVVILVDPAKSKKQGSANTAIVVLGIAANKRKYLLDGFCHKMSLFERWKNLRQMHYTWSPENSTGIYNIKVGYEVYGSGAVDLEYFKEEMKKEGRLFPIIELASALNGSNRKADRIERIQPDLKAHSIFVPYKTDKDKLTKAQQQAIKDNCEYRLSRQIKRHDESGKIYDLSLRFAQELDNYPFGKTVDLLDGFSRVYDMEISVPTGRTGTSYETPPNELY